MDGGRACAADGELGQVGYMLPTGAPVDIGSAGKYSTRARGSSNLVPTDYKT